MKKQIEIIARLVGKYFDVSIKEMRERKNDPDVVLARHVSMFYCYRELYPAATHKSIAAFFGRDHTASLHASNRVRKLLSTINHQPAVIRDMESAIDFPDFTELIEEYKKTKAPGAKGETEKRRVERNRKIANIAKDHKHWQRTMFGEIKISDSQK